MQSVNSILPTIQFEDILFLIKNIFNTSFEGKVRQELKKHFNTDSILFFDSARSALEFLAINVHVKDTPLYTQSFSCSAVIYPFLKHSIKPYYIDISPMTLNIDYEAFVKAKPQNNSTLILQYTFGLKPKNLDSFFSYCKARNITIIEDLAHAFGNKNEHTYLGNKGDFTVLSFGRDKVISSGIGGALIINNQKYSKSLEEKYLLIKNVSILKKLKVIFYLSFMTCFKKNYHFKITRICIYIFQKIKLLDKALSAKEKDGKVSDVEYKKFPQFLYSLLYFQLTKLPSLIKKRQELTIFYNKHYNQHYEGSLLKYPIFVDSQEAFLKSERKKHNYLDTWYSNGIDPQGVNFNSYQYNIDNYPQTKDISKKIINLPTLCTLNT